MAAPWTNFWKKNWRFNMPNFRARSATQPLISQIDSLVRFKGSYLLKDIRKVDSRHIATIEDIETTGVLEIRLLGDQWHEIEAFIGRYLYFEIALKRYKRGYFYYVAWFELLTNHMSCQVTDAILQNRLQNERIKLREYLIARITRIKNKKIRILCFKTLKTFITDYTLSGTKHLMTSLQDLSDTDLCFALIELEYRKNPNIEAIGLLFLSCRYSDTNLYHKWEHRLLGN